MIGFTRVVTTHVSVLNINFVVSKVHPKVDPINCDLFSTKYRNLGWSNRRNGWSGSEIPSHTTISTTTAGLRHRSTVHCIVRNCRWNWDAVSVIVKHLDNIINPKSTSSDSNFSTTIDGSSFRFVVYYHRFSYQLGVQHGSSNTWFVKHNTVCSNWHWSKLCWYFGISIFFRLADNLTWYTSNSYRSVRSNNSSKRHFNADFEHFLINDSCTFNIRMCNNLWRELGGEIKFTIVKVRIFKRLTIPVRRNRRATGSLFINCHDNIWLYLWYPKHRPRDDSLIKSTFAVNVMMFS